MIIENENVQETIDNLNQELLMLKEEIHDKASLDDFDNLIMAINGGGNYTGTNGHNSMLSSPVGEMEVYTGVNSQGEKIKSFDHKTQPTFNNDS